jgi:uncharacterized membrane protein YfhO
MNGYFYISESGDIREQYIHFFNLFHDLVRSGELPFWAWSYGLGGSFWNDFSYYNLGDLFMWPLLLLPKDWFPHLFLPLSIFKLILMAIGMFYFLTYTGIKKHWSVIGALIYPFVGYNIEHLYTHYFFVHAGIFFPYILLGYEKYLKEKKPLLFVFSIFIASISNFYLMFMLSLGLGLYCLFRFFAQDSINKTLKTFIVFHLKLVGFYALGLGLSMVVFLPSVISYLSSNAQARTKAPIDNLLSYEEVLQMFFWKGGINYLSFILLPTLLINGRKLRIYGLLGVTVLAIITFPEVTSIFGGFSKPEEFRSFFIFNFLLTIIGLVALNEIDFSKPKNIIVIILTTALIFNWLNDHSYTHYMSILLGLIVMFTISVFVFFKFKRKALSVIAFIALFISITSFGVIQARSFTLDLFFKNENLPREQQHKGIWSLLPLMDDEEYNTLYDNQTVQNVVSNIKNNDGSFYRMNVIYPGVINHNSSLTYNYNSFGSYHSLLPWSLQKFEMDVLGQLGGRGLNQIRGPINSTYMTTLLSNKYYVDFNTAFTPPYYDYEKADEVNDAVVYRNKNHLPIGFVYENALNESYLMDLPLPYRERTMFEYATIPDQVASNAKQRGINLNQLGIKEIGSDDHMIVDKKTKITPTSEGIMLESEEPINIKLPLKQHSEGQLTVYVDFQPFTPNEGITITSSNGQKAYKFVKNMSGNVYAISQYSYADTINSVVFNYGVSSRTNEIEMATSPGKFLIKDVGVYSDIFTDYHNIVKNHQKNGLNLTEQSNNQLKGQVNSENGGVMFLSIPYSEGWKVKVDGEKVDTFPVHTTFTGFLIEPGEHTIEMNYIPVGFIPGASISILSLLITIVICRRKRIDM